MSERWKVHTLVFDLDDTLYPESEYVRSGFRAVDAWLREYRAVEGFFAAATTLFAGGRRKQVFDEVLRQLQQPVDAELVAAMLAVYRGHTPVIALSPEAEAVLAWAGPHFNLAVVTDGYAEVQLRKLVALGLDRRVPCRVVTDEMGRQFWKPHSAGFEKVMAHFPGAREGYVYVADNPAKDFAAPRQLGWKTIRFRGVGGEHAAVEAATGADADITVTDLARLPELLVPRSPWT